MAAADLQIVCFMPAAQGNYDQATTFSKVHRTNFKYSFAWPEGCVRASWTVPCEQIAAVGFPQKKARVLIWDPVRVKYIWRGVLIKPKPHYSRGALVSIDYEAWGVARASTRQFEGTTVVGPATTTATVIGRINITDLSDAMKHGITIADLVNGTQTHIVDTGIVPADDSGDFRGQTAPSFWNEMCNLTTQLATPFGWGVFPDEDSGDASLYFYARPSSPWYFEKGQSKENNLEFDFNEIANKIYVPYRGSPVIEFPANGDPIDYTNTPDIQTHFSDPSMEVRSLFEAQGFAEALYAKFNQAGPQSGTLVLDRDIRTLPEGALTPVMTPITEIRTGRVIEVEATKTPYAPDTLFYMLIAAAEYDEDACTMTVSPEALNVQGKEARQVALRTAYNNMTWSLLSRGFDAPMWDYAKLFRLEHDTTDINSGYNGRYFDPTALGHVAVLPASWTIDSGRIAGSSVPVSPITSPAPGGDMPRIEFAWIPVMRTDGAVKSPGTLGGMILPQVLPPERANITAIFSTLDDAGDLTAGERAHTDVQECWIDTFTVSTLDAVDVTVTVTVEVFNWDMDAVRIVGALEIVLTAENHKRTLYPGNPGDADGPVLLLHGDQLRWSVDVPDVAATLNCALSGWKNWGEFPVLIGPAQVPGNEA